MSETDNKPPQDSTSRWLILHPESDCYFEVHNETDLEAALRGGECVDVTGDPAHETLAKHYIELKAIHEGTDSRIHEENQSSLLDPDSEDEGEAD